MTVATYSRPRTTHRVGWRSRWPGDFPSLGEGVLEWTYRHLPSPARESEPFVFTPEQAERVIRFYALDPITGKRLYRRVHLEEAKGWGKSPFAAAIALAEFAGPVCFGDWDSNGQPIGVRWGEAGRPAPWVQIAAVSEDQTRNTYRALYTLLTGDNHRAARELKIDEGRTRLYLRDNPSAYLESVTASAGSREGQPLTFAVLDEPQLWKPSNGGVRLAQTILRNLAKTGGWGMFTGNAPVLGEDSVAEELGEPTEGALHFAHRPSVTPERDWPPEMMLRALGEVYGDADWIDRERILAEVTDPTHPWQDALRFFFNVRVEQGLDERWIPSGVWDDCKGDVVLDAKLPTYVDVSVAADYRSAAIAAAQVHNGTVAVTVRTFTAAPDDLVAVDELESYVLGLRARFPAKVWAPTVYLDGRTRERFQAGPEVLYNGPYFEGSRQRLEAAGVAMRVEPHSPIRQWEAAQTLKTLALRAGLVHEDDPELARQIANLTAHTNGATQSVKHVGPAASAVMTAVRQADLKARAPKPTNAVFHSW